GRLECRGDVRRPAEHGFPPDNRGAVVHAVDPVLQREHDRHWTHQRYQPRQRRGVIVVLDGNNRAVDRADARGVFLGPDVDDEVTERSSNLETFFADRIQMRTAGDERHVVSRPREQRAVVPANSSRTQHCESHIDYLTVWFSWSSCGRTHTK